MATYSVLNNGLNITFSVNGLVSGDTVRFFARLSSDPNSSIVDMAYTASSVSMVRSFYDVLSYDTAYAVNVAVNGKWIGTQNFISQKAPTKARPSNWYWSGISSGAVISIPASTWNQFCSRINEFRKYKGLSDYSFTPAATGQPMYASQANQAWNAINGISGHGSMPSSVWAGADMSASFMIGLQNALNGIP